VSRARPRPAALYAVADREALSPRPLWEAVAEMAAAGVRWIQVRAKRASGADLYRELDLCRRRLEGAEVVLWVDDRADLAALVPVAGVHLGQRDLPPAAARAALGAERWIGLSTHGADEVRRADADPEVDLVAVGPVFPTRGKEHADPVVGVDFVRRARALTRKPLVAIGGIDAGNLAAVLGAGADAAAVLGAVCHGEVGANCRRLLAAAAVAERSPVAEAKLH
jgi:thiamine-phosphate pyrophosphorylase